MIRLRCFGHSGLRGVKVWMRELPADAVHEARIVVESAGRGVDLRRGFLIATIAGLAMTFTGAFGTGAMPLPTRLLYWLLIMEAGAVIGVVATIGVRAWGGLAAKPVLEGALISLLIAFPLTLVVLGANLGVLGSGTPRLTYMITLFAMVFAVTALITTVNYATARPAPVVMSAPAPESARSRRPRLADRLPPHLRDSPIHALQAEDHYLRIHTETGSDLILMRMTDAILELDGLEGTRTHRSWWVSRVAVRAVTRKDGRATLTLPNGIVAPVSRSTYPELRDAGWFG